jgi:uncharacterized protein (TIGR03085 family)
MSLCEAVGMSLCEAVGMSLCEAVGMSLCEADGVTDVAAAERAALLDLLEKLGPDAPTLCEGWTTHDLAAHLVARERRPQAVAGIVVRPLRRLTEAAEAAERARPYAELVSTLRGGPPLWSAGGLLRGPLSGLTDVHEMYVHHEDVRRLADPAPRAADADLDTALWKRLRVLGSRLTAKLPDGIGITAETPDGRSTTVRRGADVVVVRGTPAELFLFLFGRRAVAHVELAGSDVAREAVLTAQLGV